MLLDHCHSPKLLPYDYITWEPGEYSSKPIYTQGAIRQVAHGTNIQRMNIYKLWGHSIDGWTTIQKSSTVLTINQDPGDVLWSVLPIAVGQGYKKGTFSGLSLGSGSLIQGCWLSDYWFLRGLDSLFCHVPSFAFKLTFLTTLTEILWSNPSPDGQNCHTWNNSSFSLLI